VDLFNTYNGEKLQVYLHPLPLRLRDLGPETIAMAKLDKETSRKNQLQ
jgi:hypothetical protein